MNSRISVYPTMSPSTPIPESFILVFVTFLGEQNHYILKDANTHFDFVLEELTTMVDVWKHKNPEPHTKYTEWVRELNSEAFASCGGTWNRSYFDGELVIQSKAFTRSALIDELIRLNYNGTAATYGPLLQNPTVRDRLVNTMLGQIGASLVGAM